MPGAPAECLVGDGWRSPATGARPDSAEGYCAVRGAGGAPQQDLERSAAHIGRDTPAHDAARPPGRPVPDAPAQEPDQATPPRAPRLGVAAPASPVFTSTFVVGHAASMDHDSAQGQRQGMRSPLAEVQLPDTASGAPHWAGSGAAQGNKSVSVQVPPPAAKPQAGAMPPLQACLSPQLGGAGPGSGQKRQRPRREGSPPRERTVACREAAGQHASAAWRRPRLPPAPGGRQPVQPAQHHCQLGGLHLYRSSEPGSWQCTSRHRRRPSGGAAV